VSGDPAGGASRRAASRTRFGVVDPVELLGPAAATRVAAARPSRNNDWGVGTVGRFDARPLAAVDRASLSDRPVDRSGARRPTVDFRRRAAPVRALRRGAVTGACAGFGAGSIADWSAGGGGRRDGAVGLGVCVSGVGVASRAGFGGLGALAWFGLSEGAGGGSITAATGGDVALGATSLGLFA